MRIMHVCKKFPNALGGDAVVVAHLREQQKMLGHSVSVVTSNCDEIASQPHIYKVGLRDTATGLDYITPRRIMSLLLLGIRMFWIVRCERPDVIHTHSVDMAFFASAAARWYGVSMVHTFHIVTFYDTAQAALRRKSELWLAKKSRLRATTAPNAYDVGRLQSVGLAHASLLPNGVDTEFWGVPKRADKVFTFVAIGRLEVQKGYEYLIRAAALLLHNATVQFRVVIMGDGSQRKALQTLIDSLHVEAVVMLVGRKSPREVREWYAQADVAVFPSLYETTPITVLEAWAARVAVIATRVGILRDVPADFAAACIVPTKDPQALCDAMQRSMTDAPYRNAIAVRGQEEANRYTWPTIAQAAEALYKGAV